MKPYIKISRFYILSIFILLSANVFNTPFVNKTHSSILLESRNIIFMGISENKSENFFVKLFRSIFSSNSSSNNLNHDFATPTLTPTTNPQNTPTNTPSPIPTINPENLVNIVSITDGDTIKVRVKGKIQTIRLIGIDSQEMNDYRANVRCLAKEATSKLKELLTGHKVLLENDPSQADKDKYNRILRYIFRDDGLFVNEWMVKNGYANEYTYNIPYEYQTQFKEAEKHAKENNQGLWSKDICLLPTPKPTLTPKPTAKTKPIATVPLPLTKNTTKSQNTQNQIIIPDIKTNQESAKNSSYSCNCSKICDDMSSCEEAYFQLNTCGCRKRDGDNDGVPCESICQ